MKENQLLSDKAKKLYEESIPGSIFEGTDSGIKGLTLRLVKKHEEDSLSFSGLFEIYGDIKSKGSPLTEVVNGRKVYSCHFAHMRPKVFNYRYC